MKTISNSAAEVETLPLPCNRDKKGVLQYDADFADSLIMEAYGDDTSKYELDKQTLQLYYKTSLKLRFKIAEINYESYFTDIKGQDWEGEFSEMFDSQEELEDYEIYNITLFHYNHKSLKSNLIEAATNKLKEMKSRKHIEQIIENIERGMEDEDSPEVD